MSKTIIISRKTKSKTADIIRIIKNAYKFVSNLSENPIV